MFFSVNSACISQHKEISLYEIEMIKTWLPRLRKAHQD